MLHNIGFEKVLFWVSRVARLYELCNILLVENMFDPFLSHFPELLEQPDLTDVLLVRLFALLNFYNTEK